MTVGLKERTNWKGRPKMQMTEEHIDYVLERAQALLWSGSLHEVDEAHNLISKLIKDRMGIAASAAENVGA